MAVDPLEYGSAAGTAEGARSIISTCVMPLGGGDAAPPSTLAKVVGMFKPGNRSSKRLQGRQSHDSHDQLTPGRRVVHKVLMAIKKFGTFIGPGFMISVAYIDPGNYSTDIAAGASYRFSLLFVILMSNVFAILLQSLTIKLGTVTGRNLAESCRAYLPRKLNLFLYALAELAIIATDIAEVIGTAIALNLLIPQIPLVAGCAISICDVMLILIFYRPTGGMSKLRPFEIFVAVLVIGVVVSITIELTLIEDTSVGDVFHGYLPSSDLVEAQALYQACGILGATVMPHSLYLGSGIVQSRLFDYDVKHGHVSPEVDLGAISEEKSTYQPSISAINSSLKYSIAEVAISLFTFALFVNSSILIVAGASLYNKDGTDEGLFAIHDLLSETIAPAAGTIFALALLFSGVSAGIVCTIAGQMVSEGALRWAMAPWLRRLVTRSISITPSIIIAGAVGKAGLSSALVASQVILSVVLPFVSAPLIYFTCRDKFMKVHVNRQSVILDDADSIIVEAAGANKGDEEQNPTSTDSHPLPATMSDGSTSFKNNWLTTILAVLIWIVITLMNIANIILMAIGVS